MNENESTNTEVVTDPAGAPASESETEQTATELTTEEKLAERERLVSEREQALAIAEKRGIAARHLNESKLPEELAKYVNIESEESIKESVTELHSILDNYAKKYNERLSTVTICTGLEHGQPTRSDTGFLKGLTG